MDTPPPREWQCPGTPEAWCTSRASSRVDLAGKEERPLPVGLVGKSACAFGGTRLVGKKKKIQPADWQWIPGGGSGVPASGFPKRIPAGGSAFQGGAVEFQWISSPRARDREAPGQALRPSPAPGQAPPDSELTSGEWTSRDWTYSNWSLKEWTSGEWNSSQSTSRAWQCPGNNEARNPDPDPAAVPGAWAKALVAAFEGYDWGLSGGGLTAPSRPGRIPVTPPDNSATQGQTAA